MPGPGRALSLAATTLVLAVGLTVARGADPIPLRVRVFPGVQNLPLFAGQAQGSFARHGLQVQLAFTPSSQAVREGFRSLGSATALLGPYQATGAFVRRAWAEANGPLLERYIRGYVEALRWALAPAHRDAAVALLAERLQIAPDVAAATYTQAADPAAGLAPDARLDLDGFRNVLALRA